MTKLLQFLGPIWRLTVHGVGWQADGFDGPFRDEWLITVLDREMDQTRKPRCCRIAELFIA